MDTVRVISSDENEALLERVDGVARSQYVISRYLGTKLSGEEFIQKYPAGKQFETDLTKVWMRVYAVDTKEEPFQRFETGLVDGIGRLYFDRKTAQEEADAMQKEYGDGEAWVVGLDVL